MAPEVATGEMASLLGASGAWEWDMANDEGFVSQGYRDMHGLVTDEDYEQFKDILLEALHKEWPKATLAIEDGEHASVDVEFAEGDFPNDKALREAVSDVESRIHEIANDVIEEREWATEEEYEGYDDDLEELEERRGRTGDDDDY